MWDAEFMRLLRVQNELEVGIQIFKECRHRASGTVFQPPASISELVIQHWDELAGAAKIQIKRLQALRDGDRPTEYEIEQLSSTGTPVEVLRQMAESIAP
jgi:hypothetical protein